MVELHQFAPRPAKALSIRQPWCELILLGRKQYELRTWTTRYRGEIWLHSGLKLDTEAVAEFGSTNFQHLQRGALVGFARLTDCRPFTSEIAAEMSQRVAHFSAWTPGLFAWRLQQPVRLKEPIPYRGRLGLFAVNFE